MKMNALKKELRARGIRAREELSLAQRSARSEVICARILELEEYKNARTILLYRALRAEASVGLISQLAAREKKRVGYPLCAENLELRVFDAANARWKQGPYGIWEPDPRYCEEIDPKTIDLVLCPLAAFDRNGDRIGMGAAYYDRFLPRCENAEILGVAFACQEVEPGFAEEHDVKMDAVVTENGILIP